tara:strand:- start:354 stop:2207 length:1854 start_codon:yes stop_codon:yes gene_type:complete
MKRIMFFLLLLLISNTCFSQEQEKLPEQPWTDIIEMNSHEHTPITKWVTDINVVLEGVYTKADELVVAKIVKKLDSLTETISIKITNREVPNLKILFLDTPIHEDGNINSTVNGRLNSQQGGYISGEIYVYKMDKTDEEVRNTLESRIARTIVNGSFIYPLIEEKRNSIFNPLPAFNNSTIPLNQADIAIVKAVYKNDLQEKLEVAEKQFDIVLKNLRSEKISNRDRTIWWVKNPWAILILPILVLILIFVFLLKKINQALSSKIKNDWFRFGVISFITLLFVDILIILCISFDDFLTIPDKYQTMGVFRNDTLISTSLLLLVIVFPFLFLLRFIELKISQSSQKLFTKTSLIFLSSGFLPFIIFFMFMYFTGSIDGNRRYYNISVVFTYLMAFALIRAFISYFIFKERNLIVENEMILSNLRELKTKAELKSLQSQINPHFLYNSLNSIASLAPTDPDKSQQMAYSLSNLFKYSINRKDKKMSTLSDEIAMVENYLEIEKIRFGERLQFTINVDEGLGELEIPMFLIQPLIENAIKHGLSKIEGHGIISLQIEKTSAGITIAVTDNGPDFPEGLVSGHGLQTVHDLLRLSYGDKASLNWKNSPTKTITITIPETHK